MEVACVIVTFVIKNNTYYRLEEGIIGSRKKLKKLERKVKDLEAKVEQLEKRTNESRAYQVACWILVLLEIAVALLAIIGSLLS